WRRTVSPGLRPSKTVRHSKSATCQRGTGERGNTATREHQKTRTCQHRKPHNPRTPSQGTRSPPQRRRSQQHGTHRTADPTHFRRHFVNRRTHRSPLALGLNKRRTATPPRNHFYDIPRPVSTKVT